MFNIYKTELKKFLKSKLFIVIILLIIIMPLIVAGSYKLLDYLINISNDIEDLGGGFDIKILMSAGGAFVQSFTPLNNFGLILLIFVLLITSKDFSQGTIRNKVLMGYSRKQLYGAHTLLTLTIGVIGTLLYALFTYLFVGIFISFEGYSILELFKSLIPLILAVIIIYLFVSFIVFKTKSFGMSLGIVFGSLFILTITYTILGQALKETVSNIISIIFPFLIIFLPKVLNGYLYYLMILSSLIYIISIYFLGRRSIKNIDFK